MTGVLFAFSRKLEPTLCSLFMHVHHYRHALCPQSFQSCSLDIRRTYCIRFSVSLFVVCTVYVALLLWYWINDLKNKSASSVYCLIFYHLKHSNPAICFTVCSWNLDCKQLWPKVTLTPPPNIFYLLYHLFFSQTDNIYLRHVSTIINCHLYYYCTFHQLELIATCTFILTFHHCSPW